MKKGIDIIECVKGGATTYFIREFTKFLGIKLRGKLFCKYHATDNARISWASDDVGFNSAEEAIAAYKRLKHEEDREKFRTTVTSSKTVKTLELG